LPATAIILKICEKNKQNASALNRSEAATKLSCPASCKLFYNRIKVSIKYTVAINKLLAIKNAVTTVVELQFYINGSLDYCFSHNM